MAIKLAKDQIAMELFLAIHQDDKDMITRTGTVPRRVYTASNKSYISLRESVEEAVVRVQELCDGRCDIDKQVLYLLKIQFSVRGFYTYGTTCSTQAPYAPLLYKIQYSNDDQKDWKAWAFHADLPLNETSGTGEVLIASEWLLID